MSGLSGEDRARLEVLGQYVDCEVALRALALIDQQEKALGAALDLLDSLGAPHYHDLIGMTYTLRKEQADNLRAALEPAFPTPTEQREAEGNNG